MLLLLVLATAACDGQRTEQAQAIAASSFDGALATEAAARVAHGERLTWVLGCRGCHGPDLQGEWFYELQAANLTRDAAHYDDAALERVIREGRRPGGRELWAMPSEIFQHLSAPDMEAVIAHLRTLPPAGKPTPPLPAFSAELRKEIAEGKTKSAAQWTAELKDKVPADLGPAHALGRYIAMVTCAECHGERLEGNEGGTPDLVVAGAYSRDEFERLMTSGVPTGGRKLKKLMANVAKERFSRMTKHERDSLYRYLKARAER
jgi:cytochrome c553